MVEHAYPHNLVELILDDWAGAQPAIAKKFRTDNEADFKLPPHRVLDELISVCYQSSLLLDEGRFTTFRVILCNPRILPEMDGPPGGLHRLTFKKTLAFNPHELRRLSQAAPLHRALMGVSYDEHEGLRIWGYVHSGPRWLRALQGGRGAPPPVPPSLIVTVGGPGQIEVSRGAATVGQLRDGKVYAASMNIFSSRWLPELFADTREEYERVHQMERAKDGQEWAELDSDITRVIGQNMVKRTIAAVRAYHHGGLIVWLPDSLAEEISGPNPYINLKYQFAEAEPRARFRTLMLSIMNRLAEVGGRDKNIKGKRPVDWIDYERSTDKTLTELDESVFEMSHLVASLSTTDGAVVLTKRFELLGFGGEIICERAEISKVAKALDLEATHIKMESIQGVGTRHRAAYRLCNAVKGAFAVVISQDGNVRAIRSMNDVVTYWDHQTASSFVTV